VIAPDAVVHPSSIVDEGAMVGAGTRIWHFCHLMPKAVVGAHCSLGQNVFVANHVTIGDHVKIQNNVSLYEGVILEDYVFCGPSMVFTNVRTPRSEYPRNTGADYQTTRVKRGASIGANATIVSGVPARVTGWMSAAGDVLDFGDRDVAIDSRGHRYQRFGDADVRRLA
jgi:UDP-2-acetamido-3-amino-2,3-dideoxy-glucuronate N-acetyltransferase